MKRILLLISVFFICICVIRVGLGVDKDVRLSEILDYLESTSFGADSLIDVLEDYATISDDISSMRTVEDTDDYKSLPLADKVPYFLDLIRQYFRYLLNTVELLIAFVKMLLNELVYLLQIAVYLLFGVALN